MPATFAPGRGGTTPESTPGQVTFTQPHIPLHTPPDRVEWNRHRNLYVPFDENTRDVVWPTDRVVFFDQFDENDVTVWLLQPDFQVTLVPCVTVAFLGDQKLHLAVNVVAACAGSIWAITAATTAQTTATLRNLASIP